jgi:hypothetical protein
MECGRVEPVMVEDRHCGVILCLHCAIKTRIKDPIYCEKGHNLEYDRNKFVKEDCSSCGKMSKCRLVCQRCEPKRVYCLQCRSINLTKGCFFGHPYVNPISSVYKECLSCQHYKKTQECVQCNLCICVDCTKLSKS